MLGKSHPHGRPLASPEQLAELEAQCYTLLEESRLRCELLLDAGHGSHALRRVHRHLGMAGYHASTWMPCGERQQCLARAHDRAERAPDDPDQAICELDERVDLAAEAVADTLEATLPADHAHLAHLSVLEAHVTLRAPLLPRRIGSGVTTGQDASG